MKIKSGKLKKHLKLKKTNYLEKKKIDVDWVNKDKKQFVKNN